MIIIRRRLSVLRRCHRTPRLLSEHSVPISAVSRIYPCSQACPPGSHLHTLGQFLMRDSLLLGLRLFLDS